MLRDVPALGDSGMAIFKVCAIKDLALQSFGPPVVVPAVGGLVREFGDRCRKGDTTEGQHPEDFELWQLAEFDDARGEFFATGATLLARGADYK